MAFERLTAAALGALALAVVSHLPLAAAAAPPYNLRAIASDGRAVQVDPGLTERHASACMMRHQAFALPPV
jgi:hypothetical protein